MGVYRRTYTKNGAKKVSRFWYCVDPLTGRERSLRVTDKNVAEIMLGEMRKARELQRAGVDVASPATRHAKPRALLDLFVAHLTGLNSSPHHIRNVRGNVGRIIDEVQSIAELTPAKIGELLAARPGTPSTKNQYRRVLSSFFGWLVATKRWHVNPVRQVPKVIERGAEAYERTALTMEQFTALVDAAPIHRAAAYVMAGTTGLRRSELAKIRASDVDLGAATVRVRASIAKNAEEAVLPLNPWAVEVLSRYLAAFPPDKTIPRAHPVRCRARGERLFPSVPMVETLHRDLKKIGVPATNEAGEHLDFHALRATFITLLGRENVPLVMAAKLARHANPRLTAAIYSKITLHDGRAAVARIKPRRDAEQAQKCV
jgi:integrase